VITASFLDPWALELEIPPCPLVFVATIVIMALLMIIYAKFRMFLNVLLIPARILLEILPLTIVFPCASVAAHSLICVLDNETGKYNLFSVGAALEFIGFLMIISISIALLRCSPFLLEGQFMFLSPDAHRNHMLRLSICFL
jgi:hypothetical protein